MTEYALLELPSGYKYFVMPLLLEPLPTWTTKSLLLIELFLRLPREQGPQGQIRILSGAQT